VEHLEDNIDDLEENLEPLLAAALSATTKKLPVLDKAKLYVLIVYSIESLLFCSCPIFKYNHKETNCLVQHIYGSMASKPKNTQSSKSSLE
jgi:exosome complex protein LRP1